MCLEIVANWWNFRSTLNYCGQFLLLSKAATTRAGAVFISNLKGETPSLVTKLSLATRISSTQSQNRKEKLFRWLFGCHEKCIPALLEKEKKLWDVSIFTINKKYFPRTRRQLFRERNLLFIVIWYFSLFPISLSISSAFPLFCFLSTKAIPIMIHIASFSISHKILPHWLHFVVR